MEKIKMPHPIAELDLEHPEDCDAYDELAPLLTRVKRQNDTIKGQMDLLRQRQEAREEAASAAHAKSKERAKKEKEKD